MLSKAGAGRNARDFFADAVWSTRWWIAGILRRWIVFSYRIASSEWITLVVLIAATYGWVRNDFAIGIDTACSGSAGVDTTLVLACFREIAFRAGETLGFTIWRRTDHIWKTATNSLSICCLTTLSVVSTGWWIARVDGLLGLIIDSTLHKRISCHSVWTLTIRYMILNSANCILCANIGTWIDALIPYTSLVPWAFTTICAFWTAF